MYSEKLKNIIPAMSILFNEEAAKLKKQWKDVVVLSLWESFFDIPLMDFWQVQEKWKDKIYHYSDIRGIESLRKKLIEYYNNNFSTALTIDNILVSTGSKTLIYQFLSAILNNHDDVLVLEPARVSYTEQIKLCNANPITIPFDVSVFDIEDFITSKTKLLILNNPNNPSGKNYTKKELEYMNKLSKKHKFWVLSDEAYSDFVPDDDVFVSLLTIDSQNPYLVATNSMSKNFWMSWWRIGYIMWSENLIDKMWLMNWHIIWWASTILEYYYIEYFDDIIKKTTPQIKNTVKIRNEVKNYAEEIWLKTMEWNSTFYIFVSIEWSKYNSFDFAMKLLKERYVSTVAGLWYWGSCDKYIRIGVWTESLDRVKYGLMQIKEMIVPD